MRQQKSEVHTKHKHQRNTENFQCAVYFIRHFLHFPGAAVHAFTQGIRFMNRIIHLVGRQWMGNKNSSYVPNYNGGYFYVQ